MSKVNKKIGINLLYMNRRLSGGSITYGINLVNELAKLDSRNSYIIYVNKDCEDLPLNLGVNFKLRVLPFYNKIVYIRYFWEQIIFPFILFFDKLDVLHSLGYVGPLFCPSRHIVSVLDLNYKRHVDSMSFTKRILLGFMVRFACYFSTKIITISDFSKYEISSILKINPDKIVVTHLSGSNDQHFNSGSVEEVRIKYNITTEYIIAFGSPSSHKNIHGLIFAFSLLCKDLENYSLVLVGHQHNNQKLNSLIFDLNLSNKVFFTGFVPDEHVFPLIKASKLFVFPSFYEGFGIPILDAQSLGVPVASSFAASLPEVGKDAALYFDPKNIEEMMSVIKEILENPRISNGLIKKGLINRANYSWAKTALLTFENY